MTPEKIKLLVYTGASGYEASGSVWLTDENVRKWAGLSTVFDVTLLAIRVGADKRRTARLSKATTVTWVPRYVRHTLKPRFLSLLWRRIRGADAFITFMPEVVGIVPLLLALAARKPRYMLMQATSPHFRSWRADGRFLALASRLVINCLGIVSTRVLVQGSDLQREFVPPLRRKCVEVMISTLTEEDFQKPTPPDLEGIRLLAVSRLVPNKRLDVILRTTRTLLDRGLDARLTLLGEGPLQGDLLALARELNIEDNFEFVGLVDDRTELRSHYASASLFVLSSETEGLSLAVMEAMAAGTPVIATAPGGMKSFLRHGSDSIVIPKPDPEAFADAIQKIVVDPQNYLKIAHKAQEKVRPHSNKAWAGRLEPLIRQDLGRRLPRGETQELEEG